MESTSNVEVTQQSSGAAPVPVSQPVEKMVPQSKVDEIVKSIKGQARQEMEQVRSQIASQQSSPSYQSQPEAQQSSPQDLRKVVQEEAQKMFSDMAIQHQKNTDLQEGQRMADEFHKRINDSAEKYPNLAKSVETTGLNNFPHVVAGALEYENTADIMHELIEQNPIKLAGLQTLFERSPYGAKVEMDKLVNSMKLNEAASNVQRPQEPLSRIKTSNSSIKDDSDRTVKDWQRFLLKRGRGG